MAVTLQQIAEAAGVSRGTVDRAMNNRGRVNAEVAERIRKLADEMGYQPNRAGRALAMSRKSIAIGVVIQAADTPFMEIVLKGVLEAKEEVERLGAEVMIRKIPDLSAEKAIAEIRRLKKAGCNGIAVVPVEDDDLKEEIGRLTRDQIPVVTFNSDLEESGRLCFVGQDTYQSGRVAAGLMSEIIPSGGHVLVISGYPSSRGHKNRASGFIRELSALRPDIRIPDVQYAYDDDRAAGRIAEEAAKKDPELAGIYLAAEGVSGVCGALKRLAADRIKVISNDLTTRNLKYLEEGRIRFLIGQDGFRQGYEPVKTLFEKLFDGKDPERELIYTEIVIKNRYNITT